MCVCLSWPNIYAELVISLHSRLFATLNASQFTQIRTLFFVLACYSEIQRRLPSIRHQIKIIRPSLYDTLSARVIQMLSIGLIHHLFLFLSFHVKRQEENQ